MTTTDATTETLRTEIEELRLRVNRDSAELASVHQQLMHIIKRLGDPEPGPDMARAIALRDKDWRDVLRGQWPTLNLPEHAGPIATVRALKALLQPSGLYGGRCAACGATFDSAQRMTEHREQCEH